MNKKLCVILLVMTGIISAVYSTSVYAKSKSDVFLTTLDVKEPYEVIDIVSYRSSIIDFNSLISGIKKAASGLNADAVVGLRCTNYGEFLYAYGTAVKFK